jgi:hypothetical protein
MSPLVADKIMAGIRQAVKQVIDNAIINDDEIVIAGKDGKPIRVKARKLKK